MTTTLNQLLSDIATATGVKRADVQKVLDATAECIANELESGGDVRIAGLGTLRPAAAPERVCRNPRTGEPVQIPAGIRVKFSAAKPLLERLNKKS